MEGEKAYLELLNKVIQTNKWRKTRNGEVSSTFSEKLDFDLTKGFPLLTTKKMFLKGIIHELLWFINGSTDAKILQQKGVNIWNGNSSREFLDSIGLNHYDVGDIGPMYGFQWRHFNAEYKGCNYDYTGCGIDQLQNCINLINNDPMSRRIIMSAFNPCQLKEMVLNPCHVSYQFYVDIDDNGTKYLSCMMYQRSGDLFLGVPFNIASTALLTHMIAKVTNCIPSRISLVICDAHIYKEHLDAVNIQLQRTPYQLPKLKINSNVSNINDFKYDDFILEEYKYYDTISAKMIP
jgi:thymidylate synthase